MLKSADIYLTLQTIVSSKQVIVCTLTNNALRFLREQGFHPNLTIIDEAAQALECVAWYSLLLSPRAVIVGDPWQLPPVLRTSRCSSNLMQIKFLCLTSVRNLPKAIFYKIRENLSPIQIRN